jgi:hypothetical protein
MAEGFYMTPNVNIPLNKREAGEIADVALNQLAEWEAIARPWPMERHIHNDRPSWCCAVCDKTIYFVNDPRGEIYVYTDAEILALKVAHIRQAHSGEVQAGNGDNLSVSNS